MLVTKCQISKFYIMAKKIEKPEKVVLTKLQAAVLLDAMMVAYGLIVDQIPMDDLVAELAEHRVKLVESFKNQNHGK